MEELNNVMDGTKDVVEVAKDSNNVVVIAGVVVVSLVAAAVGAVVYKKHKNKKVITVTHVDSEIVDDDEDFEE